MINALILFPVKYKHAGVVIGAICGFLCSVIGPFWTGTVGLFFIGFGSWLGGAINTVEMDRGHRRQLLTIPNRWIIIGVIWMVGSFLVNVADWLLRS